MTELGFLGLGFSGFGVWGLGFWDYGLGFRDWGLWLRVWGLGFGVLVRVNFTICSCTALFWDPTVGLCLEPCDWVLMGEVFLHCTGATVVFRFLGNWGLGFGIWGVGFGVEGLEFGVWGLGFGFGVWGLGFGV